MEKASFKKIGKVILRDRLLKVLTIFNVVIIILTIGSFTLGSSYKETAEKNEREILKIKQTLLNLESLAAKKEAKERELEKKEFATYEQVIPFITLLEGVFTVIDPSAEITITSSEEEIVKDRFADYKVTLKIRGNEDILFEVLDQLYASEFITKLMNFGMNYRDNGKGVNELFEVNFVLRLFLA